MPGLCFEKPNITPDQICEGSDWKLRGKKDVFALISLRYAYVGALFKNSPEIRGTVSATLRWTCVCRVHAAGLRPCRVATAMGSGLPRVVFVKEEIQMPRLQVLHVRTLALRVTRTVRANGLRIHSFEQTLITPTEMSARGRRTFFIDGLLVRNWAY